MSHYQAQAAHAEKDYARPVNWRLSFSIFWRNQRNKWIGNPAFQRWAARFPLTRIIANRRAQELHHLTAGFVYSQTLSACAELGLFEQLHSGPLSAGDLASRTDFPLAGLETLLQAAAGIRLIEQLSDGRWILGELGAAMNANPGIGAMVEHHRHLYRDLEHPLALLRERQKGHLAHYWPYASGAREEQASQTYSELMALSQQFIADHVLNAYPLARHRKLLDLGGGTGAFARSCLERCHGLHATVMDLPEVTAHARSALPQQARLTFYGGDMFKDPIPTNADIISLIRIAHDHDDTPVKTLLKRLYDALPENGTLLLAEPMAKTPGAEAIGDTYFGLYLWAMGSGRPRSAEELAQMLREAGFDDIREHRSNMPCLVRILSGEKSNSNL